jgi:thymidylate kinase
MYFDVPDEVMAKRLVKRGETSGRIDDNEETIQKRLKTFHEETTPILGYYGKQGKLVTIDTNRQRDEVFTDVSQALERLMDQNQVGKQLSFVFCTFLYLCAENSHTSIRSF